MKIGTCVHLNRMETIREKFENMRREGFDNCQLVSWTPALWTEENAAAVAALIAEFDITVSAFWCGWEGPAVWNFTEGPATLGLVPPEYRTMRIKNLCDGADFARRLCVFDVVTHMGFIPENPADPLFEGFCGAVREVALHLKVNGQRLLFETGQETPVAMLRCFERVGLDNLAVNLDTANLILYGKANPADALDVIGKYVRNLHAKDGVYPTDGHSLGAEKPVGEGKVDFYAVLKRLHDLGYDSFVTIECELSGDGQNTYINNAKAYLEGVIDKVCAGDAEGADGAGL